MRILLTTFFVSLAVLTRAQPRHNFKIHGLVKEGYAYKILLRYVKDSQAEAVGAYTEDVAVVEGNGFSFSGYISEPVQAYLILDGQPFRSPIYLDTCDIVVELSIVNVGDLTRPRSKIQVNAIRGSASDNLQKEFYATARSIMGGNDPDSIKSQKLFESILTFVKQYPNHNLSSEFLESAYPLSHKQAKIIYDHLSAHQKAKASKNGVADFLNRTRRLQENYIFMPQPDTLGNLISGKERKYKYMLIHFWASYARQENQNLSELYAKYNKAGFEILGVSIDDKRAAWVKTIKDDQLIWPQIADLQGANNALYKYYTIPYVPFDFLIDDKGKVIFSGFHGDALKKKIEYLFR